MANKDRSIRQWIERFDSGGFASPSFETQCEAGWYDWFCRDTSLKAKTYKLAPKVKQIAKSPMVDIDKMYVFFKNNCPMNGSLYDQFKICDMESGDVIFAITPSCGHKATKGRAEVWGKDNDFEAPLVSGTWKDIRKFFGV